MGKPKPIRRQGPNGPQQLAQALSPPPTNEEFLAACMQLGQDINTAQDTLAMYQDEILDGSDIALVEEVIKENRSGGIPEGIPVKRDQPAHSEGKRVVRSEGHKRQFFVQDMKTIGIGIKSAHMDPRNPNNSKQKITKRDSAGRVIGLEDV